LQLIRDSFDSPAGTISAEFVKLSSKDLQSLQADTQRTTQFQRDGLGLVHHGGVIVAQIVFWR
jgi:hypothetical protein